jgi:hypothetical protein
MYQSAFLTRQSNNDPTIVAIVSLFGLALSLLAIEKGLIDVGYMTNLMLLF